MKRITDCLDKLGISYKIGDREALIEFWTDTAGQDIPTEFVYDGTPEDFVSEFKLAAENYDVDEEVEIFAQSRGKNGIPSSIKILLEDMQEAKDTLMDLAVKLEGALRGKDIDECITSRQMNKNEFMQYIDENYSCGGGAKRLIKNILDYVDENIIGEDEQYIALCELLDGTIGLTDAEITMICL